MINTDDTTEDTVTSTIERLATGEELREIADPEQRLKAAAETAERALAEAEAVRLRRDAAAVELYRTGVPAVRVYKDTLGVSRTLWGRILDLADPVGRCRTLPARKAKRSAELAETIQQIRLELAGLPDEERIARLRETAKVAAAIVRKREELAAEVAEVRNRTAYGLISREYGYSPSNADVARWARVTTARIAQLRKSY